MLPTVMKLISACQKKCVSCVKRASNVKENRSGGLEKEVLVSDSLLYMLYHFAFMSDHFKECIE